MSEIYFLADLAQFLNSASVGHVLTTAAWVAGVSVGAVFAKSAISALF